MIPQYITADTNKPAKLFREDFYTTHTEFEIGVSELLKERTPEEKDNPVTIRQIKNKMHELLYNEGMGAFKTRKATAEGKRVFKELCVEFYEEMKELPTKKATAKQETEDEKPAKAPKKSPAPKKEADTKPAASDKKKAAVAPDFAAATGTA